MDHNPNESDAVRAVWDRNAEFWDSHMGEAGNDFQRELVGRPTERLLSIHPGETVLDVACGSGIFARRLAEAGARVTALDISERMLERARAHSSPAWERIEYLPVDACDEERLLALGAARFDAAVCTMALMDMAEIAPLARALSHLLKMGGRFVFSVCHPCFNSGRFTLYAEREDREGELVSEFGVKVRDYARSFTNMGLAIAGQPVAQHYFHRPLSSLLVPFFEAGFTLDALEEPTFEPGKVGSSPLAWENFPEDSTSAGRPPAALTIDG